MDPLSASTVLTFGGILLLLQIANFCVSIFAKLRRQPPIDRTLQDYVTRKEFEAFRAENNRTNGKIFDLIRDQGVRVDDQLRGISMQLGRLEARQGDRNP